MASNEYNFDFGIPSPEKMAFRDNALNFELFDPAYKDALGTIDTGALDALNVDKFSGVPGLPANAGFMTRLFDSPIWTKLFGGVDKKTGLSAGSGAFSPIMEGILGLGGLYLGNQQLKQGKKMLAENRRQFDLNFGNQVALLQDQKMDQARARYLSNPNAYDDPNTAVNRNPLRTA